MRFRELRADEIECRVSRVNSGGVELLLFKDARCDMRILDETVGPENWQRKHETISGVLYCSVGVFTESNGWVWKQDCGTAGNIETEKSTASDAFKRACVNWGIGRSLYTSPRIFVYADKCRSLKPGKNGKMQCYDHFKVAKALIEDGRIKGIRIVNEDTGQIAFSWKEA